VEDRGRQFVLRLLPPGGPSAVQIDLQARWLRELAHEPCLCVPALVATISGEVFASVPIEGERSPWRAVLVKWVEGSPLRPAKRFATPDVLREVGAVVARMHRVSERFASDTSPARMIDADALVGSCSSLGADAARLVREEDLDSLRESAARIDAVLSSLPTNSEHVGLIHADLEPANWVFQRGKACPIDFDAFGRGFYLFDLLTVLWTHASWDDYPRLPPALIRRLRADPPAPELDCTSRRRVPGFDVLRLAQPRVHTDQQRGAGRVLEVGPVHGGGRSASLLGVKQPTPAEAMPARPRLVECAGHLLPPAHLRSSSSRETTDSGAEEFRWERERASPS
jgi:aminoglycoside phosphotransferase (APT) family kinase protein